MILNLEFSNFYSFAGEAVLSFEMGKKPMQSSFDINLADDERVNKAVAVIGPNGAGKTQFIKPLAFLSWFISSSFLNLEPDVKLPYRPHLLNEQALTTFVLRFIVNGEQYKYSLTLKDRQVVSEALYKKTSRLYSFIFVREFVEARSGEVKVNYKQRDFSFSPKKAREIRRNASLLSAAYSFDVPEALAFVKFAQSIRHNVHVYGRFHYDDNALIGSAHDLLDDEDLRKRVVECLSRLDLGMTDVVIRKEKVFAKESGEEQEIAVPYGVHQSEQGRFELRFREESSGTKSAFVLLTSLIPVLVHGGIAVIDELDNDLHPHMLPHLLDLFRYETTNPHNAQIVFSCHTPEILNVLQKHQVYLVEKAALNSESWRLDDVAGLRADDNLYAKYMAGALEAVPNL
ncbi:AAA family ATPase [Pseudidiomarina mangrovi]|uniref:AAA family ATPase n=1 Tax=Pseudidiomarina mangrovi TaxID=2487133 RepID=UPI000FCC1524|nr:ATP-binding protein [Pseudidiomarina mangrovi]